jgi:DNA-binding MarR family transcriptional regulator
MTMELTECINFLLTITQKTVSQFFFEKIGSCDVTPGQYSVLKCLWTKEPQTPSQIGQSLMLDSASMTGLLDRLANKNLLKRIPHEGDRRAIQVVLTPEGKALESELSALIVEANKDVLVSFSNEEQEKLMDDLNAIINTIKDIRNA